MAKHLAQFASEVEQRVFLAEHDSTDYVDWSEAKRVVSRPPKLRQRKAITARTRGPRLGSAFLLLVLLGACGDRGGEPGVAASGEWEWRAEVVGRIGSLDDASTSLTTLTQVLIGPDDQLYVAQRNDSRILVYDDAGNLTHVIGRRGQGPGEFEILRSIGLARDTLYASDDRLGRISYFSLTGSLLGTRVWNTTIPESPIPSVIYGTSSPDLVLADGTALTEPSYMVRSGAELLEAGGLSRTIPRLFLRVDPEGMVINTVVRYETSGTTIRLRSGIYGYSTGNPFAYHSLSAMMADGSGVVIVDRVPDVQSPVSTFQVTLVGPAGDTTFTRSYDYAPSRVTPDDIVHILEHAERARTHAPQVEIPPLVEREQAFRAAGLIPSAHVPVTALATGQDGTIWLRGMLREGPAIWTVIDRQGEMQGQVRIPLDETVIAARGDALVTHGIDDYGVPYIVRYQLSEDL